MNIIVGKTAGFCYGVKNAVDKSIEELEKGKPLCCLGEIVHNQQVVDDLKENGMTFIEDLEENIDKRKTIIRAHGVSKEIYNKANELNIELLDLTCPNVVKIHNIVEEYTNKGYFIFVIGTKKHPETIGTAGFCKEYSCIIENEDDINEAIDLLAKTEIKKLAIVVQTTFSLEKFNKIVELIKQKILDMDIKVINTICNATKTRQEETEKLSKQVESMIIIGGKNSSNTKKLFEIASKNCSNTILIETYKDLSIETINSGETIGIMAGASTPQKSIQDVVNALEKEK